MIEALEWNWFAWLMAIVALLGVGIWLWAERRRG
jgi:hypothetical protein